MNRLYYLFFVSLFVLPFPTCADPIDPSVAEAEAIGVGKESVPSRPDLEGPLVDPYVKLPLRIHDATSTSLLMRATQDIIEATRVIVPAGSRPIRLVNVVKDTLQRNLVLQSARKEPLIVGSDIDLEKAVFDPLAFARVTLSRENIPTAGFFAGGSGGTISRVEQHFQGAGSPDGQAPGLGVTRKFQQGTEVTLRADYSRQDSNVAFFQPLDQEYHTSFSADATIPLMRGAGCYTNLAGIRIAYNNKRISEEELRRITIDSLRAAHHGYWELVFGRVNLAINQQSLALAADLLRENRIRYKYGDLIAVDVYEAEAGVREREQEVIQADNQLENAMDDVRERVSMDRTHPDWEAPLTPIDPPVFVPVQVDEDLSLQTAMEKNPDIRIARLNINNAREGKVIAQDLFRPKLDIVAGVSERGLGETWGQSHEELESGEFSSWHAGIDFEVPLYRRREKAEILKSNYTIHQAQLDLKEIEQRVVYDHRAAFRRIEDLERAVYASKSRVRAEKNRLEKQNIGHEQGITTSHDLLEVQEDYAQAHVIEIRAIVDYYLALIELEAIRGTILESFGFTFIPMEGDLRPPR